MDSATITREYDIYFNSQDGARYMVPDIAATSFDDAAKRFLAGSIEREPAHRFVHGRDANDAPDDLSLNLYCGETDEWQAYNEDGTADTA